MNYYEDTVVYVDDEICNDICGDTTGTVDDDTNNNNNSKTNSNSTALLDLLDRDQVLQTILHKRNEFIDKLHQDYGKENFEKIFLLSDKERTDHSSSLSSDNFFFRPILPVTSSEQEEDEEEEESTSSIQNLKRKLMIKVLKVQIEHQKYLQMIDQCECPSQQQKSTLPFMYEKYVWATGGNSVAAATTGADIDESYSAIMEGPVQKVFGSIGIDFKARKYGMDDHTTSAGEVAMCFKEIYGDDIDFFSWDFGSSDEGQTSRLLQYAYRGASTSNFPAFLALFHGNMNLQTDSVPAMAELERTGLSSFYTDGDLWTSIQEAISSESTTVSPRKLKKLPALVGNGLALFLIEMLLRAVQDLALHDVKNPALLLHRLMKEEQDMQNSFRQSLLPELAQSMYQHENSDDESFDASHIFAGPSLCHTARMPARTRYLGYLMDTPDKVGEEGYYVGMEDKLALSYPSSGNMRLTFHKEAGLSSSNYHDFFFATDKDGWTKFTFPNEAEKFAYRYNEMNFRGIFVMVFHYCPDGVCEDGKLLGPELHGGDWEMTVNDQVVTKITPLGHDAMILENDDGIIFHPNDHDSYDIQVKVNKQDHFVKISSLILY